MNIKLKSGKYVVAVSGGVDSVVLLDILQQTKGLELVVAHFDHGIRGDSADDRRFVQGLAKGYDLPFEYQEGNLGSAASEDTARQARYDFLHKVRQQHQADAIITAHHQDDVLETMIINLLRGTGRRGLSSLQSKEKLIRPLLVFSKVDIITYANKNDLPWREDSTNSNLDYLRNYIRQKIVPKLSAKKKAKLLDIQNSSVERNLETDSILKDMISSNGTLNRHLVIMLSHSATKELIAHWLAFCGILDFDSRIIEKVAVAAKTYLPGKKISIKKNVYVVYSGREIFIEK